MFVMILFQFLGISLTCIHSVPTLHCQGPLIPLLEVLAGEAFEVGSVLCLCKHSMYVLWVHADERLKHANLAPHEG